MIIIGYLILAVIVMGFSIQLSNYVDIIDKRTSISGAFIGGVILAAITSLPELFTSISATALLGQPELVIGNILGSDIFNNAVLASLFLAFPKRFRRARIGASHNLSLVLVAAIYLYLIVVLGLGLEFTIFNVSIHSIVLLAVYLYGVRTMSADDGVSNSDDSASSQLSIKQIILRFVLCSVGLVAASIALTYATDAIASRYQIGTTLAGGTDLLHQPGKARQLQCHDRQYPRQQPLQLCHPHCGGPHLCGRFALCHHQPDLAVTYLRPCQRHLHCHAHSLQIQGPPQISPSAQDHLLYPAGSGACKLFCFSGSVCLSLYPV